MAPDAREHVFPRRGRVVAVADGMGLAEGDEFILGLSAQDFFAVVAGQAESHGRNPYLPRSRFISVISAFWAVTMS
jgi:hypothetical protein